MDGCQCHYGYVAGPGELCSRSTSFSHYVANYHRAFIYTAGLIEVQVLLHGFTHPMAQLRVFQVTQQAP